MNKFNLKFLQNIVLTATASFVLYKLVKYGIFKRKKSKIIVIQNIYDWNIHEAEIIRTLESSSFVGIDCEWVTVGSKRNPVALLQIATNDGFCVLLRLCKISPWLIPRSLAEFLIDGKFLKVGVDVCKDATKLFQDYGLSTYGLIDLRFLAQALPEMEGKTSGMGLKSLAIHFLGIDLCKEHVIRCSDWESPKLNSYQIEYAASDAIVSAQLFAKLSSRLKRWKIISWLSNDNFDLQSYIDVPFKQYIPASDNASVGVKQRHLKNKQRYCKPRQKPLYDNCRLEAPDGELLCICEITKAKWYAQKGLGKVVCNEPFTVRLNFEPSGRPVKDDIYYTKIKKNACVVCGKVKDFHRKCVVPVEYRKHFPEVMKKSLSHDVLLLCVECHKLSNFLDQSLRQQLAIECDAPIKKNSERYKVHPVLGQVKSAAKALHKPNNKIPEERRQELEKMITDHYDITEITDEVLEEAIHMNTTISKEDYVSHGLKVFQHVCKNGGLIAFERRWRQNFLDTMKPKFLPTMWSINHNHERLAYLVVKRRAKFDLSILGLEPEVVQEVREQLAQIEQ